MTQSSAPALSGTLTENKVEKSGMFLVPRKRGAKSPRLPRNPPQSHHEFTIQKTPLFAHPPQKRPQNRRNHPLNRPTFFIRKLPSNIELIEPDSQPIENEKPLSNPGRDGSTTHTKVSAHAAGTNPGSRR
jgi:hypothetical protein